MSTSRPKPTELGDGPRVVNIYKEPYEVFIGRPTKWGNPFSHMDNTRATFKVSNRDEAIRAYRKWITTQPHLLSALPELRDKVLGCFCKPLACHGDVLMELANG